MRVAVIIPCVVAGLGFFGAWSAAAAYAGGDFSLDQNPVEAVSFANDAPPTCNITEDITTAHTSHRLSMALYAIACPQSAHAQPFVWQVRDSALSRDPLTISYQPPEQVTLSFEIDHPRRVPTYTISRLPQIDLPLTAAPIAADTPTPRPAAPFTILAQIH